MVKSVVEIAHCPCGSTLSSFKSLKKHLLSFKHVHYCNQNNINKFDVSEIICEKYDLESLTSDSDDDTVHSEELIYDKIYENDDTNI